MPRPDRCSRLASDGVAKDAGWNAIWSIFLLAALCFGGGGTPARAQPEQGLPLVQAFADLDLGEVVLTDYTLDQDGLVYGANPNGIVLYNGVRFERWETLPNNVSPKSLDADGEGHIWVAGDTFFGYFAPDRRGAMVLTDLTEDVTAAGFDVQQVIRVRELDGRVYLLATGGLLRWRDGIEHVWPLPGGRVIQEIGGALYVVDQTRGLLRVDGDDLTHLPGSERFTDARYTDAAGRYVSVLASPGPALVVGTTDGLWKHDGATFTRFATEADAYFAANPIMPVFSMQLEDGRYAIATVRGGVVFLDHSGRLLQIADEEAGLPDNTVYAAIADPAGGLWVSTGSGSARVHPYGLHLFDERLGIDGAMLAVERHQGRLYVATTSGVHRAIGPDALTGRTRFELVDGPPSVCFDLVSTPDGLLAAYIAGIHEINDTADLIDPTPSSRIVLGPDGRAWATSGRGTLVSVQPVGGTWASTAWDGFPPGPIRSSHVSDDGAVWLGNPTGGIARVRVPDAVVPVPERARVLAADAWTSEDGLPEDSWTRIFGAIDDQIVAGTYFGLYAIDQDAAPKDTTRAATAKVIGVQEPLGRALFEQSFDPEAAYVAWLDVDDEGRAWSVTGEQFAVAYPEGDEVRLDLTSMTPAIYLGRLNRISAVPGAPGTDTDDVWTGGVPGLIRLPETPPEPPATYPAFVSRVSRVGMDSVLVGGHGTDALDARLASEVNALRFEVGAASYTGALRFRYRLAPFEEAWSEWTDEPVKDYTNLPTGGYTFEVQAEDRYHRVSQVGTLSFDIAPWWYETVWARMLFALLAVGLVGLVASVLAKRHTRALVERAEELEQAVEKRTAEVEQQKAQLAEQAERLRTLDQVKTEFFSNVSHEFRTPLTLTLGPLEDLRSGFYGPLPEVVDGQLDLALRNARRVLRLVNEILDVAKLEVGRLRLQASEQDLGAYIVDLARPFVTLAERKGLRFDVEVPDAPVLAYFEAEQFEKIVANLLANAFKFTPPGGTVTTRLHVHGGEAVIDVRDTGPGIPAEAIDRLFDRFYQVNESERQRVGTGLGLALAKELTELHGGTIAAESDEGVGSTFTVRIPLGRAHLHEDQIADVVRPRAESLLPAAHVAHDLEGAFVAEAKSQAAVDAQGAAEAEAHADPAGDLHDAADQTTVLVVEDNAEVRAYLRRHLEADRGGAPRYRVLEAADGAEGLAVARAALPDLVLSDVMMPEMDGYGLCAALKADLETDFIPVVLLTARATAEDKLAGLGTAADDYVTKPFDIRELRARVDNLIAGRRRLRERFGGHVPKGDGAAGDGAAQARADAFFEPPPIAVESAEQQFLSAVRAALEASFADEDFTVERLADDVGLSRGHLHKRLSALTGQTPSQAIRTMRLERAAQLLEAQVGTVSEVAYAVGFKSVSHFSDAFKRVYGCRPTSYREAAKVAE